MPTAHDWIEAARLRTLPLSVSSVILGGGLAAWYGAFSLPIFLLSILTACLLQILSNFGNDYGDFKKGSDGADRVGPSRAVSSGAITPVQMRKGIFLTAVLCAVSGSLLLLAAFRHNAPALIGFAVLGACSIAAAMLYTLGPKPYGYNAMGDFFAFLFFGPVAVAGSFLLYQTPVLTVPGLPACAAGLLTAAVININNIRDMQADILHGKNTVAIRLGPERARRYHVLLVTGALLCWAAYFIFINRPYGLLFLVFAAPVVKSAYVVANTDRPALLDKQLKITSVGTGLLQCILAGAFAFVL